MGFFHRMECAHEWEQRPDCHAWECRLCHVVESELERQLWQRALEIETLEMWWQLSD